MSLWPGMGPGTTTRTRQSLRTMLPDLDGSRPDNPVVSRARGTQPTHSASRKASLSTRSCLPRALHHSPQSCATLNLTLPSRGPSRGPSALARAWGSQRSAGRSRRPGDGALAPSADAPAPPQARAEGRHGVRFLRPAPGQRPPSRTPQPDGEECAVPPGRFRHVPAAGRQRDGVRTADQGRTAGVRPLSQSRPSEHAQAPPAPSEPPP